MKPVVEAWKDDAAAETTLEDGIDHKVVEAAASRPAPSRWRVYCHWACCEFGAFCSEWFGAVDLANAALGPVLNGAMNGALALQQVGIDDDDVEEAAEEAPAPMAGLDEHTKAEVRAHRKRQADLPDVNILRQAFNMDDSHIEKIRPFTGEGGWKLLTPNCQPIFNMVCKKGESSIDFEGTQEFFRRVGREFFLQDFAYLLNEDLYERFDNDGLPHGRLNFKEAFRCFKSCVIRHLREFQESIQEGGASSRISAAHRTPKQSGYKKVMQLAAFPQGSAWLVKHPDRPKPVVLKSYKKGTPKRDERLRYVLEIDELAEELILHTKLTPSDHVMQTFEIFQDASCLHSVCELMPGGDLTTLRERAGVAGIDFSEANCFGLDYFMNIFKQCLKGVSHLHQHELVHCDLKEASIMLKNKKISDPQIAIIDLGMAKVAAGPSNCGGTPGYRPPETYAANGVERGVWYPKGDIFSLGVTFFQLLADRVPNGQTGKLGIFQEGARLATFRKDIVAITAKRPVPVHLIRDDFPKMAEPKGWLVRMMTKDRITRPTASQLIKLLEDPSGMEDDPGWGLDSFVESDVTGKAQEDIILESDIFPYFILLQTTAAVLMWFITVHMNVAESEKAKSWTKRMGGLERFFPGDTVLLLHTGCTDHRWQVWRWVLYQFSHVGVSHIGSNTFLNLIIGLPLEKLHGSWKAALMYNIGVAGGALCYFVGDARNSVVGMSGGCYSLIGVQLAYTIINWHQRRYRKVVVVMLFIFVAADMAMLFGAWDNKNNTKPSNSAHLGGAIAGLVMGIILGKNLHVKRWELYLWWGTLAIGLLLVSICMGWLMVWPPASVWDPLRWCWSRRVYNATLFTEGLQDHWRCVRCADQACIDKWSQQRWIADATRQKCESEIGWADVN